MATGARMRSPMSSVARATAFVVSGGNAGTPNAVDTPPEELDADLFVISPEAPLVEGLADRLRAQGKRVYGPGIDGARLEGSKAYMKQLLAEAEVPTARYGAFDAVEPALEFLRSMPPPYVVKTDGLAAGKGVLVTESLIEAEDDVKAKLAGASFGDAGRVVVIEEGLSGPELSVLAVCDGVPRRAARHPRRTSSARSMAIGDPTRAGWVRTHRFQRRATISSSMVMDRFIEPTVRTLRQHGIDYRGTLYAGLMLTPAGPKLLEYNVRFGDPEAQVVLPRLSSDLCELLASAADGKLVDDTPNSWMTRQCAWWWLLRAIRKRRARAHRSTASTTLADEDDIEVFCAGVAREAGGRLVTAGGRVLDVVGFGPTIAAARARAYDGVRRISFPGMQYRNDIAAAAAREG